MIDDTEDLRRSMQAELNRKAAEYDRLEAEYGQVWDTAKLSEDFEVLQFAAPFVIVRRKSDGVRGSLAFQHSPRFYFGFQAE